MEGGRWTSSGCVVLEASETHTVCSCNQMVNLAIIMAYGELTVSTNSLHSGSPNARGKILSKHPLCVSHGLGCCGRESWGTDGVCDTFALGEFRI